MLSIARRNPLEIGHERREELYGCTGTVHQYICSGRMQNVCSVFLLLSVTREVSGNYTLIYYICYGDLRNGDNGVPYSCQRISSLPSPMYCNPLCVISLIRRWVLATYCRNTVSRWSGPVEIQLLNCKIQGIHFLWSELCSALTHKA